jgi:hypothetical protein
MRKPNGIQVEGTLSGKGTNWAFSGTLAFMPSDTSMTEWYAEQRRLGLIVEGNDPIGSKTIANRRKLVLLQRATDELTAMEWPDDRKK